MPFVLAFITLFAAIDIIAVLPIFHALTGDLAHAERTRVARQSAATALVVAVGFAFAGKLVFRLLGIEVYDFKVAGGLLLLIFSVQDLVAGGKARRPTPGAISTMGVVPIGMPLIVGPAVLTTILILIDSAGYTATLSALIANLALVWAALILAPRLLGLVGEGGAKAIGKLASLLLAAIGVRMIRLGLTEWLATIGAPAPHR